MNHEGQRFCNEMDTRDVVSAAILAQPQEEALLVFDQTVRQSLVSIETYSNQHLLCEGSTLEELAGQLGIPADQFAQAVSRYNAWQKAGHDDDFGRSATGMLGALETAPFYAAGEVTGGLHGANRLGGNGVADIVVNGRLAGLAASKRLARSDHP